jgi:hypothetical protein
MQIFYSMVFKDKNNFLTLNKISRLKMSNGTGSSDFSNFCCEAAFDFNNYSWHNYAEK